ncbi:MAG TPA: VWA domain-containing protein, partial [Thermoplasmata archaeon]|nr:VWA domain-containing protein [Thermoplasmata archaeon]
MGAQRARSHGVPLLVAGFLLAVLLGIPPGNPVTAGSPDAPALSFTQNVLVDDGTGNSWTPSLAIDGGGKLHVAWSDDRGGFRRIFYSNSMDAGTTWSPDWEVCGCSGSANTYDPATAVDRSGGTYNNSVYIVWRETAGADADVYLRRSPDRGASWLPRVRVDAAPAGITSTAPVIALGAVGEVFVAYADVRNNTRLQVFVRRSFDGGATWTPETQVSQTDANSAMPALAAGPRDFYVAWRELETTTLVASLWVARTADVGNSWTARVVDTGAAPTDRRTPQAFVAPDGAVHLIWIAYDLSGIPTVKASRSLDDGATWSAPLRTDDAASGPLTYRAPRLAHAAGDLYAVWADNRNGDADIFYTTSATAGAAWGDLTAGNDPRVDDTDANGVPSDDATEQTDPGAVSDGYGVYVAWSDRRAGGNVDLYFSRFVIERVLVTEVQDAPGGSETVEIAAYGPSPISLAGYRLEIEAFALDLTGLGTMLPGQHKVAGDPAWADLVYDIPVPDEGAVIRLIDGTGAVVDVVATGQRGPAPDPIAGETVQRAWTGAKYSDDWARSPTSTWRGRSGVPVTNPAPPVVLNEVLFNPTSPADAFIELFYPGIAPLDLFGFVIAGDATFAIPVRTVSAADPYYVLRTPDAPALFAAMDAFGDNVYLYDAGGALLDMAGWSTAHAQGGSMARVPEGFGGHAGYDDATSIAAGWRFDRVPTVPLVVLRQDQQMEGNLGDTLQFLLSVVQKQAVPDVIDLTYVPGPDGWAVTLIDIGSGSPLQDHDGDGVPDTDRLPPGVVFGFAARVQIPAAPPVANSEAVVVAAQASLTPLARSTVTLVAGTYPRIEPSASVDTNPIWVAGTPPPYPTDTNLTLTIAGRGSARVRRAPQDVVLLLDRSGSLADAFCPGCFPLLKDAAKTYVDNLSVPDQAAVIYFTNLVILKGPLTTDYARVKTDIDSESVPQGGTQIGEAIRAANNELAARGISFHFWAIILLTDGQDNVGGLDPIAEARTSATLGIRIFTIGLGPTVDETMLRNIASLTGGEYLHAATAADLYGVYEKIGTLVDSLAGYDSDITDDIPMVEVTLPPYILIAPIPPNRFVDPATGGPRAPDYRVTTPAGTVLQWNVSTLRLNETWSVRFAI